MKKCVGVLLVVIFFANYHSAYAAKGWSTKALKAGILSTLLFSQSNFVEGVSHHQSPNLRGNKNHPDLNPQVGSLPGGIHDHEMATPVLANFTNPNALLTTTTGDPFPNLPDSQLEYFTAGKVRFATVETVVEGLGPRFNAPSCAACHSHPAIGGSSPPSNPLFGFANADGFKNQIPSFITLNGPIREVRFKYNPDGSRDGGVHDLFVITGSPDAPNCLIKQPNFAKEAAKDNLSFRIPTPTFGTGLIEAIEDSTILANKNTNLELKQALGISGHPNYNGNDGTITRFGWKAQNKGLAIFAGEAYNVEMGIANEIFPNERDETPGCIISRDDVNFNGTDPTDVMTDVTGFVQFMRFLAPPPPRQGDSSSVNGQKLFSQIGCALCHTPSLQSGPSDAGVLANQTVPLYSDLLVHRMGPVLADGIIQGNAGPDEFRTAPLWGVGQRVFFMHDGRTSDLKEAILLHASGKGSKTASEANRVVKNFEALCSSDQDDLIGFLQTL